MKWWMKMKKCWSNRQTLAMLFVSNHRHNLPTIAQKVKGPVGSYLSCFNYQFTRIVRTVAIISVWPFVQWLSKRYGVGNRLAISKLYMQKCTALYNVQYSLSLQCSQHNQKETALVLQQMPPQWWLPVGFSLLWAAAMTVNGLSTSWCYPSTTYIIFFWDDYFPPFHAV